MSKHNPERGTFDATILLDLWGKPCKVTISGYDRAGHYQRLDIPVSNTSLRHARRMIAEMFTVNNVSVMKYDDIPF